LALNLHLPADSPPRRTIGRKRRMSNESMNQPTELEQRIAEEEAEREGDVPSPPERTPYETEVAAEQSGTTEEELRQDEPDSPLDSAYKPRTG
jgi:hypothetical protein